MPEAMYKGAVSGPSKRRSPSTAAWLALALAAQLVVATVVACSGTTSSGLQPTTGVLVRAEALTAGRGCGKDPTQLFKYVVVVLGYRGEGAPEGDPESYDRPITSSVFDCFTDGAFVALPSVEGSSTYRLDVFAYNEPSFAASRARIESSGTSTEALRGTNPTWTTRCTATQELEVESLAVCAPLAPGLSGLTGTGTHAATRILLPTESFHLADGRLAVCAAEGAGADAEDASAPDAAEIADAEADAAEIADAEADAAAEAGAPVVFTTVRIRYRTGGVVGPTVEVACPTTFTADVAAEPRRYDLEVGVLDATGAPLGETRCSATSTPGETSTAICP